jgi:UDP-glucose 4-epimerase
MKSKPCILVTGGTGYIGSHTAVTLIQAGFEVVVIDNLSNSYHEVIDRIETITRIRPAFYRVDMRDARSLNEVFSMHRLDAVIHFAALKAVGESVDQPLLYYHNNLVSLLHLISACRLHKTDKLVFSSSCTVYGQPGHLPVTENTPVQKPYSPYGNTKKIAEEILNDCSGPSSLNVISLRYFNPCGAHQSALLGEFPIGKPNNLMPVITQTAAGLIPQFEVFGMDYATPDGSCIRDYIHITDLADAHAKALQRLLQKKNETAFEVFNVGTGHGISVMEMIHAFERLTGIQLNYKISGRRAGDIEQIWADTSRAEKVLGWKAKLTLDDMILTSWNWQKQLSLKTAQTK